MSTIGDVFVAINDKTISGSFNPNRINNILVI